MYLVQSGNEKMPHMKTWDAAEVVCQREPQPLKISIIKSEKGEFA